MNLYWVTYDPENGDVVPDAKLREYVENFIKGPTRKCSIGSATLIDEFRMLVVRGSVEADQIRIGNRAGEFHPINKYAVLTVWPDDEALCPVDKNTHDLLIFATKVRRIEREVADAAAQRNV